MTLLTDVRLVVMMSRIVVVSLLRNQIQLPLELPMQLVYDTKVNSSKPLSVTNVTTLPLKQPISFYNVIRVKEFSAFQ